jgi:hypothetical protein
MVYNVYGMYCTSYYFCYFYHDLKTSKFKSALLYVFLSFCVFALINAILIQDPVKLNNSSYVAGMAVVMIPLSRYFMEMAIGEYRNPLLQEEFWLGTGILLFHSSSFPGLSYMDQILFETGFLDRMRLHD